MGKYDFDLNLVYPDSVLKILEQIHTGATVLEFGPANGRMTKYMKEALHCNVYLAEIDEEAGKEALQYGVDLVIGDIENYEWYERYRDIRFDYILFADVLEHLRDPLEVLIRAKMLLKTDGSILMSVPNLAHNSVLINLLNNEFEYRDIGLLDNTHIHLFTKNSLEKMLSQAYLYPVKKMATYRRLVETEIPADPNSVVGIGSSFWNSRPYGEVYQFVYQVKKESEWSEKLEYELKPLINPDAIKVYRDNGVGYSEECIVEQYIYDYKEDNRIMISVEQGEKPIRIDPIEQSGLIRLVSCEGIAGEKRIPLPILAHNASLVKGDLYFFETTDPHWMVEIPKEEGQITQVEAVISYIALFDSQKVHTIAESLRRSDESEILRRTEEKYQQLQRESEEKEHLLRKRMENQMEDMKMLEEDCLKQLKEEHEKRMEIKNKLIEEYEKEDGLMGLISEKDRRLDELTGRTQALQQQIQGMEELLDQKDSAIDEMQEQQLHIQNSTVDETQRQQQRIQELETGIQDLEVRIQGIYNSRTWRWNRRINRILGRKV